VLKKVFAKLFGVKTERIVPATYHEELEQQNYYLIPILGPFLLFAWLPYIPIDKKLLPEIWIIPYLRLGFSIATAFVLIAYNFKYFRHKSIVLVTFIAGYLVIVGSLIPALANANSAYVGGLCFLIVGLATAPLPLKIHFSLLVIAILTFFGTCYFTNVKFEDKFWIYSKNDLITSFVFSGFFAYVLNNIRKNIYLKNVKIVEQNKTITQQSSDIEKKNIVITDSIEYAKNIQKAILPEEFEIKKHFPDHFILYKPKDIVSGDFYWLHDDGERVLLAVADCTGHGVPGAFMSFMGYNLLENLINTTHKLTPSQILEELNNQILKVLKQKNQNASAKFGMDVAMISFNKQTKFLEFSGAYNPLYIFRGNELIELKADKRSIGSFKREEDVDFVNHQIQLLTGDILYMFTDGYYDQIGGPESKKYFIRNFKELLQTNCGSMLSTQNEIFEETIKNWQGNKNQTDDMLIVGIKI
jgi:phosphoserine phosphatase RsbU/P